MVNILALIITIIDSHIMVNILAIIITIIDSHIMVNILALMHVATNFNI